MTGTSPPDTAAGSLSTGSSASSLGTARAELHRWTRDPVVLITIGALVALSGMLTYFAVNVATGGASAGGDGVQLQTDLVLDAAATNGQLASMPRSSLTMLVPIAAIVLGVQAAGSEMASGALMQLAVAARRLRFLIAVRAAVLLALLGIAGTASGVAAFAAAGAGISQTAELAHLSAWHSAGPAVAGAAAQSILVGLIAFGLAAITRRWIVVTAGMIIYLVVIEPVLAGFVGGAGVWLPGAAASALLLSEPDLAHVVPIAACALVLVVIAVLSLHRERAARS